MTSVLEIQDALADQIRTSLGTADPSLEVQVEPRMVVQPSALCIDIYPATPFQEKDAFGDEWVGRFVIRARITTAEHEAAQDVLLNMLDPLSATSILGALKANRTLTGKVDYVTPDEDATSGFQIFEDSGGVGNFMGCQWTVRVSR